MHLAAAPAGALTSADEFLVPLLLIGLAGVAAVALIATGVARAKRARAEQPRPTAMAQAAEALERRSVRRSKVRLAEDPIVAAMGIDHADRRQARRRARQVDEREETGAPLT